MRSAPGARRSGLRRCDAHGCRAPGRLYRGHDPPSASRVYMPGTHKTVLANGVNAAPVASPRLLALLLRDIASDRQPGPDRCKFFEHKQHNRCFRSIAQRPPGSKNWRRAIQHVYVTPTDEDEYLASMTRTRRQGPCGSDLLLYHTASTPSGGGNINWTGNQSRSKQTNANISDVHTFSPSTANQLWLTFTRAMGGRVLIPVTGPGNQTLGSFGSNFLIQGPAGLPYLNGAGFSTGTRTPARSRVPTTMSYAT